MNSSASRILSSSPTSSSYSPFGKDSLLSQRKNLNTSYDYYYSGGNRKRNLPFSAETNVDNKGNKLHPGGNISKEPSNFLFHGNNERRNSSTFLRSSDRRESKLVMLQKNIGLTSAILQSHQNTSEDEKNEQVLNNSNRNTDLETANYSNKINFNNTSFVMENKNNSDYSLSQFLAGGTGTNSRRNSKIVIGSNITSSSSCNDFEPNVRPDSTATASSNIIDKDQIIKESNENSGTNSTQQAEKNNHTGRRNSSKFMIMGMLKAFKSKRNSIDSTDSTLTHELENEANEFYVNQNKSIKNSSSSSFEMIENKISPQKNIETPTNDFWTIVSQDVDSRSNHFFSCSNTNILPTTVRTVYPDEESSIVLRHYSLTNSRLQGSLDVNFRLYQKQELKNRCQREDLESGKIFSYTITQLNKSTFRISYSIRAVGKWEINILFNNNPIKPQLLGKNEQISNQFHLQNHEEILLTHFPIVNVIQNPISTPFPEYTVVDGEGIDQICIPSFSSYNFSIMTADKYGNYLQTGGHDVDVSIRCSSKVLGQIVDDGTGTYQVSYKPLKKDTFTRGTITTSLLDERIITSDPKIDSCEESETYLYLNNLPLIRCRSDIMIFRSLAGVAISDPDNIKYADWKIGLFTLSNGALSISQIIPIEIEENLGHKFDLAELYSRYSSYIVKGIRNNDRVMENSSNNCTYQLMGGEIDSTVLLSVENLVLPNYIQNPYNTNAYKKSKDINFLTLKKHKSNNFLPVFNMALKSSSVLLQCLASSHITCEQWLRLLDICINPLFQESAEVKRLKLPPKAIMEQNYLSKSQSKTNIDQFLEISIKIEGHSVKDNAFTPILLNDKAESKTEQAFLSRETTDLEIISSSSPISKMKQLMPNRVQLEEQKHEELQNLKNEHPNNGNCSPGFDDNASFDQFEQEILAYEEKMKLQTPMNSESTIIQDHFKTESNIQDREQKSQILREGQMTTHSSIRSSANHDFEISYLKALTIPSSCIMTYITEETEKLQKEHQKSMEKEKGKKNYLTEKQLILRDKLREKKLQSAIDQLYKERELAIRNSQSICYATLYKKSNLSPTWHKRFAVLLVSDKLSRLVYFVKPFMKQLENLKAGIDDDEDMLIRKQKSFIYEAEERAKCIILLLGCTLNVSANDIMAKVDGREKKICPFTLHHPNGNKFEFATTSEAIRKVWVCEIEKLTNDEKYLSETDSYLTKGSDKKQNTEVESESEKSSLSSTSVKPQKKINIRPTIVRKKVQIAKTDSEGESLPGGRKIKITKNQATKARIRSSMIRIQNRRKLSSEESSSSESSVSSKSSTSSHSSVDNEFSVATNIKKKTKDKNAKSTGNQLEHAESTASDCSSTESVNTFQRTEGTSVEREVTKSFKEEEIRNNQYEHEVEDLPRSNKREPHPHINQHHREISSISLLDDQVFLGEGIQNSVHQHDTEPNTVEYQSGPDELYKIDLNEKIPIKRKSRQTRIEHTNEEGKRLEKDDSLPSGEVQSTGKDMIAFLDASNSLKKAKIISLPDCPEFFFFRISSKSKKITKVKSVDKNLVTSTNRLKLHKQSIMKYISSLKRACKVQAAAICSCLLHLREKMQSECNHFESKGGNYCPQYLYWIEKIDILATSGPESWNNGWKYLYQLFESSKFVEKDVICDMFSRYQELLRQQELCESEQGVLDATFKNLTVESSEEEIVNEEQEKLRANKSVKNLVERKGLKVIEKKSMKTEKGKRLFATHHNGENNSDLSIIPPPPSIEMLSSNIIEDLTSIVKTSNGQSLNSFSNDSINKVESSSYAKSQKQKSVTPRVPSHIVPKSHSKTPPYSKPLKRPEWKRLTAKDKPLSPTPRYQVVDMLEREKVEKEKNVDKTTTKLQVSKGLKDFVSEETTTTSNSPSASPRGSNSFERRLEYHKHMLNSLLSEGSPTSNKFGRANMAINRGTSKRYDLSKEKNIAEGRDSPDAKPKLKTEGQYGNIYSALLNNLSQSKNNLVDNQMQGNGLSEKLSSKVDVKSEVNVLDQTQTVGCPEELSYTKKVYSVAELLNRAKEKQKSHGQIKSNIGSQSNIDCGTKSMSHPIENISFDLNAALGRKTNSENTGIDSLVDFTDPTYLSPEEDNITNNEDEYVTYSDLNQIVKSYRADRSTEPEVFRNKNHKHKVDSNSEPQQTRQLSPKKNTSNKSSVKKVNKEARSQPYPNYLQASFMRSVLGKVHNHSSQDRKHSERGFVNNCKSPFRSKQTLPNDTTVNFTSDFCTPNTSPNRKEYGNKWQQAFKKGRSPGNGPSFFDLYPTLRTKGGHLTTEDKWMLKSKGYNISSGAIRDDQKTRQISQAQGFEFDPTKNKALLGSSFTPSSGSVGLGQKVGLAEAAEWQRLVSWLCGLGMERYIQAFADQGLTRLSSLELLNEGDLNEIGVDEGHIGRLMTAIHIFSQRTREYTNSAMIFSINNINDNNRGFDLNHMSIPDDQELTASNKFAGLSSLHEPQNDYMEPKGNPQNQNQSGVGVPIAPPPPPGSPPNYPPPALLQAGQIQNRNLIDNSSRSLPVHVDRVAPLPPYIHTPSTIITTLSAFDLCAGEEVLYHWKVLLPKEVFVDIPSHPAYNVVLGLEFYIRLYGAISPILKALQDNQIQNLDSNEVRKSMLLFRQYVEDAESLPNINQIESYKKYRLIYEIDNPHLHPKYAVLFQPSWAKALRERLRLFLDVLKPVNTASKYKTNDLYTK